MEYRKIKFRKLKTRKIILRMEYRKIKFRKLETRNIILRIECQKIKFRKLETWKIILRKECWKIKFQKLEYIKKKIILRMKFGKSNLENFVLISKCEEIIKRNMNCGDHHVHVSGIMATNPFYIFFTTTNTITITSHAWRHQPIFHWPYHQTFIPSW